MSQKKRNALENILARQYAAAAKWEADFGKRLPANSWTAMLIRRLEAVLS